MYFRVELSAKSYEVILKHAGGRQESLPRTRIILRIFVNVIWSCGLLFAHFVQKATLKISREIVSSNDYKDTSHLKVVCIQ